MIAISAAAWFFLAAACGWGADFEDLIGPEAPAAVLRSLAGAETETPESAFRKRLDAAAARLQALRRIVEAYGEPIASIGVLMGKDGRVERVFKEGPAKRAGVKAGDVVVSIDGASTKGLDGERSADLIGAAGPELRLRLSGDERERIVPKVPLRVLPEDVRAEADGASEKLAGRIAELRRRAAGRGAFVGVERIRLESDLTDLNMDLIELWLEVDRFANARSEAWE